jgi:hypothetical protein
MKTYHSMHDSRLRRATLPQALPKKITECNEALKGSLSFWVSLLKQLCA